MYSVFPRYLSAIVLVFGLFGAVKANAVTLFDSITGSNSVATDAVAGDGPLYASFSTIAGVVSLTEVQVVLSATATTDGGSVNISLWSDNGGPGPGSSLASLGTILDSALSGSATTYTFSGLSQSVAANTRYWIELATSNQSSALWWYTDNTAGIGVSGEYWLTNYSPGVVPNAGNTNYLPFPYEMTVSASASATPLPAALPLFASGLGGLGLLGWRRKRKAALAA